MVVRTAPARAWPKRSPITDNRVVSEEATGVQQSEPIVDYVLFALVVAGAGAAVLIGIWGSEGAYEGTRSRLSLGSAVVSGHSAIALLGLDVVRRYDRALGALLIAGAIGGVVLAFANVVVTDSEDPGGLSSGAFWAVVVIAIGAQIGLYETSRSGASPLMRWNRYYTQLWVILVLLIAVIAWLLSGSR
jgi:hypothetical protein